MSNELTGASPVDCHVRCVGRGAGDGCGHEGGRSGEVCPACGGMLLSDEAEAQAERLAAYWMERLAAYWMSENAPNARLTGPKRPLQE